MTIQFEISDLPAEPEEAVFYIIDWLLKHWKNNIPVSSEEFRNIRPHITENLKRLKIITRKLKKFEEIHNLTSESYTLLTSGHITSSREILNSIDEKCTDRKINLHFSEKISNTRENIYTLNKKETNKLLKLTGEMRQIVSNSEFIDTNHKKRLFTRISKLEAEFYQKHGKFDTVLAGVSEVMDLSETFGKKIKPLVDRINEIRRISQNNTTEHKELPPPDETKRLPPPSTVEDGYD